MTCDEFNEHIYEYFINPDIDWKIGYEIEEHYFSCNDCYETFILVQEMSTKGFAKGSAIEFTSRKIAEAKSLIEQGKQSEAIECLEDVLILNPKGNHDLISALRGLCSICIEYEDVNNALKAFTLLDPLIKDQFSTLRGWVQEYMNKQVKEGIDCIKSEDYEKAKQIFEDLKDFGPENAEILTNLGFVYNFLKEYENAKEVLEKSFMIFDDIKVLKLLAFVYSKLNKFENLSDVSRLLDKIDENDLLSWKVLGAELYMKSDYEGAKVVFERLLDWEKPDQRVLQLLGSSYIILEEYDKVEELIDNIDDFISDYANFINGLSEMYYKNGDIANAKKYIEKAYKADPDNLEVRRNRDMLNGNKQEEFLHIPLVFDDLELIPNQRLN